MPAKTPQSVLDEALRLYLSGIPCSDVGVMVGVGGSTLSRHFKAIGAIRTQSEAKRAQYQAKPKEKGLVDKDAVYGDDVGGVKSCAGCGENLPADLQHFYKRTRENGRAYLSSSCKDCVKAKRNLFTQLQPERVREANKRSYDKNGAKQNADRWARIKSDPAKLEAAKAKLREWAERNTERLLVYRRARYTLMASEIKAAARRYLSKNKDKVRANRRKRRARMRGAEGGFYQSDIDRQYADQWGLCFWCKCDISGGYHPDHFLALVRGGTNHPYNIVLACPPCNLSKGKKLPAEYFAYMKNIAGKESEIASRRAYMAQKMREHRARSSAAQSRDGHNAAHDG